MRCYYAEYGVVHSGVNEDSGAASADLVSLEKLLTREQL